MGTWGTGNFDNDAAPDWQGSFLETSPRPAKLAGSFERVLASTAADADHAAEALAAAEVLAALRGHPGEALPDMLADWAAASRGKLKPDWLELAIGAIGRITKRSELVELWQEADQLDAWLAVQNELLARLRSPPQPKRARPRGPELSLTRRNGHVLTQTYTAQGEALPDLAAPQWDVVSVRLDVSQPFASADYAALARWLRRYPDVGVIFDDGRFGETWQIDDAAWQAVLAGIRLFDQTRHVRLELSRVTELSWLAGFSRLKALEIRLSGPCDLSALARLGRLERLAIRTFAGNMFTPSNRQTAPHLDLAGLRGVPAGVVDLRECRLRRATEHLEALRGCHTLLFDYFFEAGVFEMPPLDSYHALRRLHFLAISANDLENALRAPSLEELCVYLDREVLEASRELIAASAPLSHVTLMLQESPLDGFSEQPVLSAELGKLPADVDAW